MARGIGAAQSLAGTSYKVVHQRDVPSNEVLVAGRLARAVERERCALVADYAAPLGLDIASAIRSGKSIDELKSDRI